jgi:cobalamin biosynthetic protein CobC
MDCGCGLYCFSWEDGCLLEHGGKLLQASAHYGIPVRDWLDLSTGINPIGWPVDHIPAETWRRLPETEDGLLEAACAYYGTTHILPVAGSQPAIQTLPVMRSPAKVGILAPSYNEHARAWKRAGHQLIPLAASEIEHAVTQVDVLVLCNPNNPTGERFSSEQLLTWQASLSARGGWLVVDEAFADGTPENTLASHCGRPGLIVLRSLGKFFGLAGARVGFVLAWPELLRQLEDELGPWAIAGASRWVARQALQDTVWQKETRYRLEQDAQRLRDLLVSFGWCPHGSTMLFQWVNTDQALWLHEQLAQRAILTRLFHEPLSIRFGLPGAEQEWARLTDALEQFAVQRPQKESGK